MALVEHAHDASVGINWNTVEAAVKEVLQERVLEQGFF